jgi:hypothetical protein
MPTFTAADLDAGLTEAQQANVDYADATEAALQRNFPLVDDVAAVATDLLVGALLLQVDLHLGICAVLISAGLSDQLALLKLIYACEVPGLCTPPSPKAV